MEVYSRPLLADAGLKFERAQIHMVRSVIPNLFINAEAYNIF